MTQFSQAFKALTGDCPFPWQEDLYEKWFSQGRFPASCDLPTGLGKTSVVAIWLIALANHPGKLLLRRLVYVVNRRTVVDQTTGEVEKLRVNLRAAGLFERLHRLCALQLEDDEAPLAISTLRGQFADNREWSADPSRPAVIVGTVDMIGSRLLFSGYGVGFRVKPLHAGFLGQDVLLVHDEAHLEPAFQKLLLAIKHEQGRCHEFGEFRVMALTATSREHEEPLFEMTDKEKNPPQEIPDPPTEPLHVVWRRLTAKKSIVVQPTETEKEKVADRVGELARKHSELAGKHAESHRGSAILVFVNSLEDHASVCKALEGEHLQVLTGTLRGLERDRLLEEDPIFARFLLKAPPNGGTVYLVCTSAGEVGIDISADHMVCDLTSFDCMVQRLGRVNRFGDGDAQIDVVYEKSPDKKKENDPSEKARWNTLDLLKELPRVGTKLSASPLALMQLRQRDDLKPKFETAYTPAPTILPASDILFDSWALTTVRGKLPGQPPVEPYLHGLSAWEPPETHVAWREEVDFIKGDLLDEYRPADLLEDYPLKPHELLRDRSDRVFKQLAALAKRKPDSPVWLLAENGQVEPFTLGELTDKDRKDRINYCTVLLPPSVGGLRDGLLAGDAATADDVADEWRDASRNRRRIRVWEDDSEFDKKTKGMRLIRTVDTKPNTEEDEEGETTRARFWHWYELPKAADSEGSKTASKAVLLRDHTNDVVCNATWIVNQLPISDELRKAVILAAGFHDLGKKRERFQRILGNMSAAIILAKSGNKRQRFGPKEDYRHEFGSLLDVEGEAEFKSLSDEMKDLVLHLIAAHHGRARPHFPLEEAFDPESNGRDESAIAKIAAEVPGRFARLQRKYGRWGLAYLESLLRAADYAASAKPSKFVEEDP